MSIFGQMQLAFNIESPSCGYLFLNKDYNLIGDHGCLIISKANWPDLQQLNLSKNNLIKWVITLRTRVVLISLKQVGLNFLKCIYVITHKIQTKTTSKDQDTPYFQIDSSNVRSKLMNSIYMMKSDVLLTIFAYKNSNIKNFDLLGWIQG